VSSKIERAQRTNVSLTAKLRISETNFACSMQNLSVGGAKIISDKPLSKGDRLELVIGDFKPIKANIAWARAPLFGLQFEAEAQEEVAEILMSVATYGGG
jgi:hypothetical protein